MRILTRETGEQAIQVPGLQRYAICTKTASRPGEEDVIPTESSAHEPKRTSSVPWETFTEALPWSIRSDVQRPYFGLANPGLKTVEICALVVRGGEFWIFAEEKWLSGMDSNHDKGLQRALCYHYTTGQTGPKVAFSAGGSKRKKAPFH